MRVGEEGRRIAAEIISLGAEMIVDDVEEHHQPAQMCFVDQRLQIIGPAIGAVGRIPQHAIIAPAAAAGEIGQRHQLERGDAGRDEMIELVDHGAIGAFRVKVPTWVSISTVSSQGRPRQSPARQAKAS